jgi:hypothetical protein
MQQRQLRLGDILDDYCPRERRLTNHAVVAMVGEDVKQTRCTTCDAEHEYKHAKVPRQRKKPTAPAALYGQTPAGGPKRHEHPAAASLDASPVDGVDAGEVPAAVIDIEEETAPVVSQEDAPVAEAQPLSLDSHDAEQEADEDGDDPSREGGPVHRPLIRASLPRAEGQPPPQRPVPEFTIRQPGGRQNRFRPRHGRGQQFHGNRSNGSGGSIYGGAPRQGSGRPQQGGMSQRSGKRHGSGRNKRSK